MENQPTWAYRFVNLLLQICLMPLGVQDTAEVTFKFMSKKTVVNCLVYFSINLILIFSLELFAYFNNISFSSAVNNNFSSVVGYLSSIMMLAVVFPVLIASGLDGFPKKIILNKNSNWPKGIWKNVAGFSLMFTGSVIYSITFYSMIDTTRRYKFVLSVLHIITVLYAFFFWTAPVSLIGVWMENMKAACKLRENDEVQHTKFCISSYQKLSRALGTFLIIYFAVIQILFVVFTYTGFTKLTNKNLALKECLIVVGTFVEICK